MAAGYPVPLPRRARCSARRFRTSLRGGPELAPSAVRGRELLPIATKLAAGPRPPEPRGRSAINRAYYAAFTELTAYIQRHGFTYSPGGGSHVKAWNFLRSGVRDSDSHRQAIRRAAADTGALLKARRQKADYHLSSKIGRAEPAQAIREAERIVRALDGVP
jgi:hypothetical protein